MLLPWPSRHEREAAISSARAEKVRSQAAAAHAAVIGQDIQRAREENNFARVIAAAFRGEAGR